MLNVLKMMNAPTNSATKPKIKKNVRKEAEALAHLILLLGGGGCGGDRLVAVGQHGADAGGELDRRYRSRPPRPDIASSSPSRSNSFWAVGRSNSARVAPNRLLDVPRRMMPEIVFSRAGRRDDLDPLPDRQVVIERRAGIDDDLVRRGGGAPPHRPSGWWGFGVLDVPPIGVRLPSCINLVRRWISMIQAVPYSSIRPVLLTPSTACTCGRTLSGIGLRSLPPPLSPAPPAV